MRTAAILATLLISLALTGCIGQTPTPDTPASEPTTDGPGPEGPPAKTAPGAAEPASAEAARWIQDRWSGQEDLVLVDETSTSITALSVPAVNDCMFVCARAFFPLEGDTYVPPGTAELTVTASWDDPPTRPATQATLAWEPASTEDNSRMPIANGEPVTIDVAPEDWDDPLQPTSLWWFAVELAADPAGTDPAGTDVQLEVVAHRNATLPTYTPPQDRWSANGTRILVDGVQRTNSLVVADPVVTPTIGSEIWFCVLGCDGVGWVPQGGSTVPQGTDAIEATVTWDWQHPTKPELNWFLEDGTRGTFEVVDDGDAQRTFRLELPDGTADSPWQNRSAWQFFATWETQGRNGGLMDGTMTLTATAFRDA